MGIVDKRCQEPFTSFYFPSHYRACFFVDNKIEILNKRR